MAEEVKDKKAGGKSLDKMTAKELRELAKTMPKIAGVYGMKKAELLAAIKEAKGIVEEKVKPVDRSIKDLKKKIRVLKAGRRTALEANDKKMATIYKRKVSRLKKKTRRPAA